MADIITIDDTSTRKAYAVGATPTAVFPVPFPFWTDSDLKVWNGETLLTRGVSYTVSGAGEANGGSITLQQAVTNTTLTIARDMPLERTAVFPTGTGFKVPALNGELARYMALLQQLRDSIGHVLTLAAGDPTAAALTLPLLSQRAGKLLTFKADGSPAATAVTAAQLDAVVQAGVAAGGLLYDVPPAVGDGVRTEFDTGVPLSQQVQVIVSVGGVWQTPAAYTVSGTKIKFVSPPPAGVIVRPRVIASADLAGDVQSVNGQTGAVVLTPTMIGAASSAQGAKADTAVQPAALASGLAGKSDTGHTHTPASLGAATQVHTHAQADIAGLAAALALLAPLLSPALTGTPTAPTAAPGTNTTQLATTAYVVTALAGLVNSSPAALDTLNELAAALGNDPNFAATVTNLLAQKAPLASPALTGMPTAPTAGAGTSTTQIATTAFVQAVAALLAPASHTHTAAADVYAAVVAILTAGTNVTVTPNAGAKTLTVSASGAGGGAALSQVTVTLTAGGATESVTGKEVVAVRELASSSNLAATATAITSGNFSGYFVASAFDGNATTYWAPSQQGAGTSGVAYFGQAFPGPQPVRRIAITQGAINGHGPLSSVLVQYSDNGSAWTTGMTAALAANTTAQTIDLPDLGAHTHWRLLANSNISDPGYGWLIAEFGMYLAAATGYVLLTPGIDYSVTSASTTGTQTLTIRRLKTGSASHVISYIP